MRNSIIRYSFLLFLFASLIPTFVRAAGSFPRRDATLVDKRHKEPKSGVQIGPGDTITIQQGVGTPSTINVLSFSDDGKLLAAGKDFGRTVVWDVPGRKFLCAVEGHQGIVHAVALSPDGRFLATAGERDGFSVKLWRLTDGKLIKTFKHFDGYIRTMAFGPKGAWLLLSDNAGMVHIVDVATGKHIRDLQDTFAPVLSPDGQTLMAVNKKGFTLWRTSDWTEQRTLPRSPANAIPLALNLQANDFVVTSSGGFRLVSLSTGEVMPNLPSPALPEFNLAAGGFAAFGVGTPLILGHSGDRLWVWDINTSKTCVSGFMYSESGALSPNGTILAGAKDNSIFARALSGSGVWLWDTGKLATKCGFTSSSAANSASDVKHLADVTPRSRT